MDKSKAIKLLKTFNPEEFRDFGLFVRSPFHNTENIQIKLYDLLKKYYPEFEARKVEKESIYKKLYPGRTYNDGAMRNIISDFLNLQQKYLRVKSLERDKFQSDYYLLKELGTRQQHSLVNKMIKEITEYSELEVKDKDYYLKQVILKKLLQLEIEKKDPLIKPHSYDPEISELLSAYFVLHMLYLNTSILNANKNIFDYNYELNFIEEIESYLNKKGNKLKDIPYIKYYFNAFKLIQTEEEEYFYELKNFLLSDSKNVKEQDLRNIYSVLINYSYDRLNKGVVKFTKELFSLYKDMLEKGVYRGEAGHLKHITYLSIVTCGLDAGEFKWTENFIDKYKDEVNEDFRGDSFNMAKAIYHYRKKDFNKSLEYASKVNSDDMAFKFNTKSLYLKIYYDMNETEPFYSHIDSFRHFASNNKLVSEKYSELLGNYIYYSKKLYNIKNNPDKSDGFEIQKILKEILNNNSILNKDWLLKKAKELEEQK